MRSQVIQLRGERFRAGARRGDPHLAQLTPLDPGRAPDLEALAEVLRRLERGGFRHVVTTALSPAEQTPFLEAGFTEREHLHLLERALADVPPSRPRRPTDVTVLTTDPVVLRRARRAHGAAVLTLDRAAFDEFWWIDEEGLHEALTATPSSRFRVALRGEPVGYAVTGRSGSRGYLQRLAVHPDHHGQGIGTSLVTDALRWLRRRRARTVLVNTQAQNHLALALYERLGFTRQDGGLAVLERTLGGPP